MSRRRKVPPALTPRLFGRTVDRITALAEKMNAKNVPAGGPAVNLGDVLRRAIDRGLDELESPDVLPLLTPQDVARLERVVKVVSTPELPITIRDVVRATFAAGLEAIEWYTNRTPWFRIGEKGGAP